MKKYIKAIIMIWSCLHADQMPHYYATAADSRYFNYLLNFIGSIHKNDYANLGMIAVFNLGLTNEQRDLLSRIERVAVFEVEQTHSDLLTLFCADTGTRLVRGWFAWKPVIIKQALDMFPYVVYADAGTTILKPMNTIFAHIQQSGYFFIDTGHATEPRMTQKVKDFVMQEFSMSFYATLCDASKTDLDAGFQGMSRAVYQEYVVPMYELSTNISLFCDDGSAKLGFGSARHDQTLFTVFAHKNGYHLFSHGWIAVNNENGEQLMHLHWDKKEVHSGTTVYRSRSDINLALYAPYMHLLR